MNAAQTNLYWREWAKVKRHFGGRGIDPKQIEAKRHELHKKALGADKSSKAFTNSDFDKVLAAFRAVTQPGNLNAQLHALDQPERRRGEAEAKCRDIVMRLPKIAADPDPAYYAENYLNNLARSVCGRKFLECDDQQLARIYGILQHRLGEYAAPVPAKPADEDVPF